MWLAQDQKHHKNTFKTPVLPQHGILNTHIKQTCIHLISVELV